MAFNRELAKKENPDAKMGLGLNDKIQFGKNKGEFIEIHGW